MFSAENHRQSAGHGHHQQPNRLPLIVHFDSMEKFGCFTEDPAYCGTSRQFRIPDVPAKFRRNCRSCGHLAAVGSTTCPAHQ